MKIIVGLGNPGEKYANTYHNLGFMSIDALSKKTGISLNKSKFNALYGQGKYNEEIVLLIKPLTYMNLSGDAVVQFVNYYKLPTENVIVFCDDIDLPKGTYRYREHGSGGTHNGLKSVVYRLNSENFKRVRIGAENTTGLPLIDYVLSKIDEENIADIEKSIDEGTDKILGMIGNE